MGKNPWRPRNHEAPSQRPLMRATTSARMDGSPPLDTARTPLPKLQLAIILLIQGAEPLTASVIFPFVNQFVQESGITDSDERKTGYYAGIIGSLFFLSECFVVLLWSRLSDRIGRKPVLLAGMLGLFITILSAGATKSYFLFALSRTLQGAFNGNIGVAKNVMVEITDKSNIADAFAFLPPVWTLGNTFGPLVGGPLARPASRWPETFGKLVFFREYPYFLSCAIISLFPLFCWLLGALWLNETLPAIVARSKRAQRFSESTKFPRTSDGSQNCDSAGSNSSDSDELRPSEEDPLLSDSAEVAAKSPPVKSVLVRPVLLSLATLSFQAVTMESFRTLMPLMFSTSIQNGGLGFTAAHIGTLLASWGLCNGAFQLLVFAPTIRRFGPKRTFRVAYGSYLVCFGLYPVMSYFAKQADGVDWKVLLTLVVQQTFFVIGAMSYGSNQLFLIAAIPKKEALATVNGVAQIVNSLMRALAPALASSLFSLSAELNLLGGHFVYLVFIVIIFFGQYASTLLPEKI